MNRLIHSLNGFIRSMQMSQTQVFVFVEGDIDTYFYGKVAKSVCSSMSILYEIYKTEQLSDYAKGKTSLLIFYKLLKRRSALIDNFKGKVTGSIFFLDKDIDDLLRTQYRSEHVVYTKYYDVENHIFKEGDLGEALAVIASIDIRQFLKNMGSSEDWRREVAEYWKDWVKLCIFARRRKIEGEYNYKAKSPLNNPMYGPADSILYAQRLKGLEVKSGLSSKQFKRAFKYLSTLVDNKYARGEYDCVFKGKWYAPILIEYFMSVTHERPGHFQTLQHLIPQHVALTLNFNEPWAEYFKEPLRWLIDRL